MTFTIATPATSANLGPGFDSLGLALDCKNICKIKEAKATKITIKGEGEGIAKLLIDNMFVRIFNAILKDSGLKDMNFELDFYNNIPVSRGMGSSSAVIVGAISAAFKVLNIPFNKQKILDFALTYENHPDNITPAVYGGFCVSILEGKQHDRVIHTKFDIPESIRAVMLIPEKTISTKLSREALPKKLSLQDCIFNLSHASLLTAAFAQQRWDLLRYASKDRIHEYKRMKQLPFLFAVQKTALENGAISSTLSGSGSAFLNLVFKDDAAKLKEILSRKFKMSRVIEIGLDNNGVEFL